MAFLFAFDLLNFICTPPYLLIIYSIFCFVKNVFLILIKYNILLRNVIFLLLITYDIEFAINYKNQQVVSCIDGVLENDGIDDSDFNTIRNIVVSVYPDVS